MATLVRTKEEAKAAGIKKGALLMAAEDFAEQAGNWNAQGNRFLEQSNADAAEVAFRQQDYAAGLRDLYRSIAWGM